MRVPCTPTTVVSAKPSTVIPVSLNWAFRLGFYLLAVIASLTLIRPSHAASEAVGAQVTAGTIHPCVLTSCVTKCRLGFDHASRVDGIGSATYRGNCGNL